MSGSYRKFKEEDSKDHRKDRRLVLSSKREVAVKGLRATRFKILTPIESIHAQFDVIETRLDLIEKKLLAIIDRLQRIEERFQNMENMMKKESASLQRLIIERRRFAKPSKSDNLIPKAGESVAALAIEP